MFCLINGPNINLFSFSLIAITYRIFLFEINAFLFIAQNTHLKRKRMKRKIRNRLIWLLWLRTWFCEITKGKSLYCCRMNGDGERERSESFLLVIGELCNQRTRSSQNMYTSEMSHVIIIPEMAQGGVHIYHRSWMKTLSCECSISVHLSHASVYCGCTMRAECIVNRHIKIQTFF